MREVAHPSAGDPLPLASGRTVDDDLGPLLLEPACRQLLDVLGLVQLEHREQLNPSATAL